MSEKVKGKVTVEITDEDLEKLQEEAVDVMMEIADFFEAEAKEHDAEVEIIRKK